MKKQIFKGSGVAIITPMLQDGSVNFPVLKDLLEMQIANSTDAVIICGTTGEASAMNDKEHLDVIEFAVNAVNHRLPVVAGTGSNDTRHAINLSKEAKNRGADALLQVTPYYNKTSQSGLVRHFNAIVDATGLPTILYNVPSRTGMAITPQTYQKLAEHPLIVATKEASGNISAIAKTAALCGDSLAIYSGNDDQIVPLLSLGGIGVISVLANVAPRQTHDICALYFAGKEKESLALQLQMLDLIDALFSDVNPIPVKAAMNLLGYAAGDCRMPLDVLNAEKTDALRRALVRAKLI
ncbi:MAG: 4-hydroxy-tetrahydrodipicolinate synthase [Ruthenibacterium sp.]